MILSDLKKYLSEVKAANLFDLSKRFDIDSAVARSMLEHWIRKGKVRKAEKISGCGSKCAKCDPAMTEVYQWIEPNNGKIFHAICVE